MIVRSISMSNRCSKRESADRSAVAFSSVPNASTADGHLTRYGQINAVPEVPVRRSDPTLQPSPRFGHWYAPARAKDFKDKKGFTMLLLIIILLLVFAGGGGYYGYNRLGSAGGAGIRLGTILMGLLLR